ncbi:MAG: hypothetical protein QM756_09500 [Polyangiaceae bacterium]
MKIQIHHDDHIRAGSARAQEIEADVRRVLSRFGEAITAVEVHLSDENGPRFGGDDKRCLIEVRLSHLPPIVASHRSKAVHEAVAGAAMKVRRAIDGRIGRLRRNESLSTRAPS